MWQIHYIIEVITQLNDCSNQNLFHGVRDNQEHCILTRLLAMLFVANKEL